MRKLTQLACVLCVLLVGMQLPGCNGGGAVAVVQNSIPVEVVDRMVWNPVTIALVDEGGDPVPDSGIPVTVSLGLGSGGIMGTTVRTSVGGSVTFDDLTYVTDAPLVMETITLVFSAPDLPPIESDEIDVLLPYEISGGADQETVFTSFTAGATCDFFASGFFVQLFGLRALPNLDEISFGSDTILDLAGSPPDVIKILDAPVLVSDIPGIFTLRYSEVPLPEAFDGPDAVVEVEEGAATLSTGGDGVAFMLLRAEQETLLGVGESRLYEIHIDPLVPGAGFTLSLELNCTAP